MTLEELRELVAVRGLAPARLMPVGQLRIATVPSQDRIAACRVVRLTVGQQRIAVLPGTPISGPLSIAAEQLAEWGVPRWLRPDGTVTVG